MTTRVTVNGTDMELPESASVHDVVARVLAGQANAATGRGVAVAVNDDVVPRTSWASTPVGAGDRIEIVTATQGG